MTAAPPQDEPAAPSPAKVMSPEQLERLRQIGLRLDRAGRFWHAGSRVEHPRLHLALLRWLDVVDGRSVVRLDERRYAYVDVEDAHLRARSARWADQRCWVLWDDEQERELVYGALAQASDHALYVPVGALLGRIASPAYQVLTERVEEDPTAPSGFGLRAADKLWPIGVRA